jgi:hypothetical protein
MPLPPRGDPIRAVYLAVRSLRLLGVLFILIGVVVPALALKQSGSFAALPPSLFIVSATHLVPGVLYLLCAVLLLRGRRAGVFAAMGLAMFHFILVAGHLATYVQLLVLGEATLVFLFISLTVGFLVVAALAQLMFHLIKSLRVLRAPAEFVFDFDVEPAPAT